MISYVLLHKAHLSGRSSDDVFNTIEATKEFDKLGALTASFELHGCIATRALKDLGDPNLEGKIEREASGRGRIPEVSEDAFEVASHTLPKTMNGAMIERLHQFKMALK